MSGSEQDLLQGNIVLRPDDKGDFDELLMMDGEHCLVHAETMDDKTLWIGFYPKGYEAAERVVMWVSVKKGKLHITAEED